MSSNLNPSFAGVPVSQNAWIVDAVELAVGWGMTRVSNGRYADIGTGILAGAAKDTAQDITHTVNRQFFAGKTAPTPAAPTQLAASQTPRAFLVSAPRGR